MNPGKVPVQESESSRDGVLVAEVHLRHPDLVLSHTITAVPEVTVRPEYQSDISSGSHRLFLSAVGDDFEAFEAALLEDPTVADPLRVDTFPDRRVYRVDLAPDAKQFTDKIAELGGRVLDTHSENGGWYVQMRIPSREMLVEFREYCLAEDVTFRLKQLYSPEPSELGYRTTVSDDQREMLVTAFEEGYYDIPRGISQNELAEKLDVSPSAVSQRLRRATAELIGRTLVESETE
ncbi:MULTISPECIES: helix-turn-helix domain-containing protein [Halorussus]|uniref:helix-turn-helix domain-containing protein n=1 Tax=Halorussus TaxID=1070314 RepID=UPI00209D884A|nr:helix-turn-helix domain-containing protein [Halorussus vallis]USZ78404.1 helix-turn-helix domain-containing protein [Halorussus vallis]